MGEGTEYYSFIHEWLESKEFTEERKQAILVAIRDSLNGVRNEELDEAALLRMLTEIRFGESSNE